MEPNIISDVGRSPSASNRFTVNNIFAGTMMARQKLKNLRMRGAKPGSVTCDESHDDIQSVSKPDEAPNLAFSFFPYSPLLFPVSDRLDKRSCSSPLRKVSDAELVRSMENSPSTPRARRLVGTPSLRLSGWKSWSFSSSSSSMSNISGATTTAATSSSASSPSLVSPGPIFVRGDEMGRKEQFISEMEGAHIVDGQFEGSVLAEVPKATSQGAR
jgi:hypothetical protein